MGMGCIATAGGLPWRVDTDIFIDTSIYCIKHASFDLKYIYFYWCQTCLQVLGGSPAT